MKQLFEKLYQMYYERVDYETKLYELDEKYDKVYNELHEQFHKELPKLQNNEHLTGLINISLYKKSGITFMFDGNMPPTAKGLLLIEDMTGFRFAQGINNNYVFLPKRR